eukprot:Lankesteria_metandrocarpae@DN5226_c0_g1_i1.p1
MEHGFTDEGTYAGFVVVADISIYVSIYNVIMVDYMVYNFSMFNPDEEFIFAYFIDDQKMVEFKRSSPGLYDYAISLHESLISGLKMNADGTYDGNIDLGHMTLTFTDREITEIGPPLSLWNRGRKYNALKITARNTLILIADPAESHPSPNFFASLLHDRSFLIEIIGGLMIMFLHFMLGMPG